MVRPECKCLCDVKDFVDRVGLGYISVIDIGMFFEKFVKGKVPVVEQYGRMGPKVCVFMKDFLLKLELSEATYGLRSWMDYDLKFGPYVDDYEVEMSKFLNKSKVIEAPGK